MVLKKLKYNTLLLVSYLFCIIFIVSKAETPPVQTWLKTSWDAPHLLLEIIESVSVENSTAYYPLINEFINLGLFSSELTYHEMYNTALDVIESKQYLSTPTSISILEFSLSLHTTAPAIQAYYHYYNTTVVPSKHEPDINFNPECDVWVDWYGHQACNVEIFKELTGISSTGKFDKLLNSFVPFHQFITDLVDNEEVEYVLRYKPPRGSRNSLHLAGYGVELALKKTDYIVIDDREVETGDHNERENENSESYNDSHRETSAIRELGLKATQFIISSQNPLNQNKSKLFWIGFQFFWLNGLTVDPSSVDPFSLLKLLRRERQMCLYNALNHAISSQVLNEKRCFIYNGKYFDLDDNYQRDMIQTITEHTGFIQQKVYVVKTTKKLSSIRYIYSTKQDGNEVPVSLLLITNFDSEYGAKQGLEALKYLDESSNARVAFIHNPSTQPKVESENSETAQKWSTILEILSQIDGVAIELYFNPKMNLAEIPIKRFYRYVLEPKLKFNTTTGNLIAPSAHFSNLPEDPLLTLGMDVIQAWLVTPKVSIHDLDNIRKPGKENEDVLKLEEKDGIWNYFMDKFSKNVSKQNKAEINIFSVASGHLIQKVVLNFGLSKTFYHHLSRILSHIWLKNIILNMKLVTYKWPHWLRAQKEKQRTIWGYKILFLDVLFPLDLDKVIFVDADQIVRADLKELVDMDLQGAPYGYTPFCDNRPEMDGFRFWKHGYWKDHLKGKPYHISALSGLPNNIQHIVPIFSLPLEWLWCETWCSDESLAGARTIDLCNNPMTKEPKLDRARRQVPEWGILCIKKLPLLLQKFPNHKNLLLRNQIIQSKSTIEVSSESKIPVKTEKHEEL
ncbi:unnamed protein product [Rhizophagus irregularis]|nr:unnamed protein product [Rhizophagus irregularis]